MCPVTDEVMALFESEQRKVLRITGTDRNGATISITDNNVIEDSFQIDRYSCNGEKLEIGTAIAGQLTLKLENGNGQYDGIMFEGAELFVEVGIADWTQSSPTVTYIPCGYFTPDEQPRRLSTISITALDRMTKFDAVVDGTQITTPITVANLVARVCTLRGVTLAQSITGLTNANVSLPSIPTGNSVTYRNLIAWCAGIMGTNAWFDWNGQLRFSWYNNATGYASTVDNRYSSDMYENDLTVTGVVYTTTGGIDIVEGTDDYALDLTGNTLAAPMISTILPVLNTALNGFSYRPFTAAAVNAPYLWPMDAVTFTDKEGNNHASLLTNVCFGLNGTTAMEARGMTYVLNRQKLPEGWTKEQAQLINEVSNQIKEDIDDSLTQQDIFNRLTENGAAQGLVLYNGQLYINASYINAGYLSAARIKGDMLTLGGANNINGTMQVLDANGNIVVTLNNDGADIVNGNLVTYDDNRTTRTRLTEGRISFDFYNDIVSPPFWLSVANISHSNDANLLIQGSNTVKITNLSGGADTDRAEIEMDDDSISLRSINTIDGNVTIDVGLDGVSFTIDDFVGGPYVFKLMKNTSSNPLSVGNGGTGANNKSDAISSLFDVGINEPSQYPNKPGIYRVISNIFSNLTPASYFGILVIFQSAYGWHTFLDSYGNLYYGFSGDTFQEPSTWRRCVIDSDVIDVAHGGTGETQGTIDITDQCSWHGSFYSKNLIYNPYLKMVFGSFAVYGNVANQAYLVTLPSSVPIVSKTPCGIGTSNTNGVAIAVDFEGRNLKSSHSVNVSVSEPRYVIQAYVG